MLVTSKAATNHGSYLAILLVTSCQLRRGRCETDPMAYYVQ